MFQETEVLKKGFTIIEILLSGTIGLLLLLVMANAFINFQKIGLMQNDNAKKHASFERTIWKTRVRMLFTNFSRKITSFPENLVKAISRSSWNRYTLFFFMLTP